MAVVILMEPKKRKSRKLPKCVRAEEWDKLFAAIPAKDKKCRIAFVLAYESGMRLSEVLRFSTDHFTKNTIFVPESKYGVERNAPLPKDWRNLPEGWREKLSKQVPLKISGRTLQRKFKQYCKEVNLNPLYTFHSLRHGFAVRCLERGMPINQLQDFLGHANIATTSIYVKANPVDAIKSYEDFF